MFSLFFLSFAILMSYDNCVLLFVVVVLGGGCGGCGVSDGGCGFIGGGGPIGGFWKMEKEKRDCCFISLCKIIGYK